MNVQVSYKAGKTPEVEREFHNQIQKLRRRLQVFKPDLVHLRAFVEQDGSHRASSSLNLRLPSGQMAAQRSGGNALAAVKAAFGDLLAQVTKHKELLRGHWTQTQGRKPGSQEVREMKQAAAAASSGVVVKPQPASRVAESGLSARRAEIGHAGAPGLEGWVNANLSRLEEYVDGELQSRVLVGQIREDQISREEVVDEVMVSALSQEDHRVGLLPAESWFHRLALQAIRRLIRSNADTGNLSLDAPAGTPNVTGSDENVLQYHQPDDSLPEESVIRDANVRTPEEIFAGEEMVAQLDIVLHEVQTQDREAFVLYTLEGFSVDEIARLAGRPPEEVRKSIRHVRERVQKKLPEENQYRRSLLRRSRVA